MSLVTRCPACATTFKVVKDQLRISDGWVRCGRCSKVFDAHADLLETPDQMEARPSSQAVEPPSADEPAAQSEIPAVIESEQVVDDNDDVLDEPDFLDDDEPPEEPAPVVLAADPPFAPPLTPVATAVDEFAGIFADKNWPQRSLIASASPETLPPVYPTYPPFPNIDLAPDVAVVIRDSGHMPLSPEGRDVDAPLAASAVSALQEDDHDQAVMQKALRRARAKSAKIAKARSRDKDKESVADTDSAPMIMAASEPEQAQRFEAPPSPPMPASLSGTDSARPTASKKLGLLWRRIKRMTKGQTLVTVAIGAGVLLVFQVLRQERDVIVAHHPGWRPLLAGVCFVSGCEISALRQIGDIKIDGASFARERTGDAYRLNFTLRNSASVPLAMPSIELSLLDTQERAVVRRILMPPEFGAPAVLPARGERTASLPLALTGAEVSAMPPIAGFRVEALYP